MGRGRPKGSKNKPKTPEKIKKPTEPLISNEEQFDNLNKDEIRPKVHVAPEISPKKRVLQSLQDNSHWENKENEDEDTEDEQNDDGPGLKTFKIIQLGSDEVKKYAILNKGEDEDDDDDDDFDREDRDISFMDNDTEEETKEMTEWLDTYTDRAPEETTIKVAKKYPSKQKFPCPKCPKIWNWPWELRRHLMIHFKPNKLGDSGYSCDQCNRKFQWKRDLKQHERMHTGEKLLVCSVCQKKFTTKQALLHHVVVHTGEKPFQCAVCGNKFTQPANLRTHVKNKHNYNFDANKNNKCEYCGEPHVSIVGLHQHLLEDHPAQVQEERESLAAEKQEKLVEKARKDREKEERRIKREQLGHKVRKGRRKEWELEFEFYIGDGLVRGVDWDRTPSPSEIGCGQCDRKFGWRFEIMFHGLCHLVDKDGNARNKICPECDTPFKVPIGLKHHLITHTGETPFLCLHCWKSFSSHIDLKLHIKKEHLMHLNSKTGKEGEEQGTKKAKRGGSEDEDELEKTSHYVQLEDGSFAEMVEGHEMVGPGQQMLVQDEDGQKLVVVNPNTGNVPQTVIIPEQAETVYVIASQNDDNSTILPDDNTLQRLIGDKDGIEMMVDDATVNVSKKFIRLEEM